MIGRGAAVAEVGPHRHELHGVIAFSAWLGVHAALMTGVRNRVDAFVTWGSDYFTRDRAARRCSTARRRPASTGTRTRSPRPLPDRDAARLRRRGRSRVAPLQRGIDVVAERERDLRGALDHARGARHRRHRLEDRDDLLALRPRGEGECDGVLEGGRRRVDRDRRGDAHERRAVRSSITAVANAVPSVAIALTSASS